MYKLGPFFILLQYLCIFVTCNITVTPVSDQKLFYGYNPFWDAKTQSFYFVDYLGNSGKLFYRYDFVRNLLFSASLEGGPITSTFMLPVSGCDHEFAISDDKRIVIIRWDGVSPTATVVRNQTAIEQDPIYATNHLDIGGIDPKGRLVTGTYRVDGCNPTSSINGTLYVFKQNKCALPVIHNAQTVAGFAWNRRKKLFYFFDSCAYNIVEYNWSPKSGNIRDPRVVFTFSPTQTYAPLGMDISCDGKLFVALYMGSDILKINPRTGLIEEVINVGVPTINGLAFGGPKMDTLLVTTSQLEIFNYFNLTATIGLPSSNPLAGQVLLIKGLNTKGCPGKRLKNYL